MLQDMAICKYACIDFYDVIHIFCVTAPQMIRKRHKNQQKMYQCRQKSIVFAKLHLVRYSTISPVLEEIFSFCKL